MSHKVALVDCIFEAFYEQVQFHVYTEGFKEALERFYGSQSKVTHYIWNQVKPPHLYLNLIKVSMSSDVVLFRLCNMEIFDNSKSKW